jgi:four helix bundle protein
MTLAKWGSVSSGVHNRGEESARPAKRTHRDLIVWRASMDLLVEVYRVARKLPDTERFALAEQLRRAALSIPSNIAEGFGRGSRKDFLRHLHIASGSLRELESHVEIIRRLNLALDADTTTIDRAARRTANFLHRLQQALSRE